MTLGEQLLTGRNRAGYTRQELADKLFVTRQTLSQWEHDKRTPDLENLAALCRLLKLDARDLLDTRHDRQLTMDQLLGAPMFKDIRTHIQKQQAYMQLVIADKSFPDNQPGGWLFRQLARYRFAVGTAEFNDRVVLKDEKQQVFFAERQQVITLALVQSLLFSGIGGVSAPHIRYRTLVTIQGMHLLIATPLAVPALIDWATSHQVKLLDPMQLVAHRERLNWAQLTQADFERLAAGTPYVFPYQMGGASLPIW